MTQRTFHPDVLKRLKRAQGHLNSVIAMLGDGRDCVDIAQQLHAVEKAVSNAKKILVHDHVDHCLEHNVRKGSSGADKLIQEFKEITKYL